MALEASVTADVADEEVAFELTVTNEGDDPVDVTFGSGQTAEFEVSGDDSVAWRWSDERMFTQQVHSETVESGESIAAEGQWSDPSPGTYAVEATLTATDHRPSASATFEVSSSA